MATSGGSLLADADAPPVTDMPPSSAAAVDAPREEKEPSAKDGRVDGEDPAPTSTEGVGDMTPPDAEGAGEDAAAEPEAKAGPADGGADCDDTRPALLRDPAGEPGPRFALEADLDAREARRLRAYRLTCWPAPRVTAAVPVVARLREAKRRLETDRFDAVAWTLLVDSLAEADPSPELRAARIAAAEERCTLFPTCARAWIDLAALVADPAPDDAAPPGLGVSKNGKEADDATPSAIAARAAATKAAKAVYARCLLQCPDPALYASYLAFVGRLNGVLPDGSPVKDPADATDPADPTAERDPAGLVQVRQAHEFVCARLGGLPSSGPLWKNYIAFLRRLEVGTAAHRAVFGGSGAAGQEAAAQTEAVREAYRRALAVPQEALDELWPAYEKFEMAACPTAEIARKHVEERLPEVNLCRMALAERRRVWGAVQASPGVEGASGGVGGGAGVSGWEGGSDAVLARPPGLGRADALAAWTRVAAWEKGNRQRLGREDLSSRVSLAYEQALASVERCMVVVVIECRVTHRRPAGESTATRRLERETPPREGRLRRPLPLGALPSPDPVRLLIVGRRHPTPPPLPEPRRRPRPTPSPSRFSPPPLRLDRLRPDPTTARVPPPP